MNRLLFFIAFILISHFAFSQNKSITTIDFNPYEIPVDIIQVSDGYFITGTTGNHSTDTQFFYLKTDENFNVIFSHIASYNNSSIGTKILKTESDNLLLNGYIGYHYSQVDVLLFKLNNDGEILDDFSIIDNTQSIWRGFSKKSNVDKFCFYGMLNDQNTIIETDADFNSFWETNTEFFILNSLYTNDGIISMAQTPYDEPVFFDYLDFIKYDLNGNQVWHKRYGNYQAYSGKTILNLPNNEILFAGSSSNYEEFPNIFLYNIDSEGNENWQKTIGDLSNEMICNDAILIGSQIFLVGTVSHNNPNNGLLIKTDLSGNIIWSKEYPISDASVEISKILQKDDESLLLIGNKRNNYAPSEQDIIIIETNLDGTITNTSQINTPSIEIKIHPNPADDLLKICNKSITEIETISIINSKGQEVMNIPYSNEIDIKTLSKGVYIIKITGDNKSFTEKIIIN